MQNIAVFPNIDKEDAPKVLERIFRFFADKDEIGRASCRERV